MAPPPADTCAQMLAAARLYDRLQSLGYWEQLHCPRPLGYRPAFHPVQEELSLVYDKDMTVFERFDSGADNGHCGLTDCQVQSVCSTQLKTKFETFVATDTCTAAPYSVDKICAPPAPESK